MTNKEAREMVANATEEQLPRLQWLLAVISAESFADFTTRELAEMLMDGIPAYGSYTAQELADELFPDADDDCEENEPAMERVMAAMAGEDWN